MQRYVNSIQDATGNALATALVRVYLPGGTTAATIYSDNGVTAISQPLAVDSTAEFGFYAANGTYDIKITYSAVEEWLLAQTLHDPADAPLKLPCRVATTANITLSGTQAIDAVAAIAGDRVLVKNQTAGSANGVYVVAAGAWTRATDADTSVRMASGAMVPVVAGTTNAASIWMLSNDAVIVLGTTTLTFSRI